MVLILIHCRGVSKITFGEEQEVGIVDYILYPAILCIVTCLYLGSKLDQQLAYRFVSDSNTFLAFTIGFLQFYVLQGLEDKAKLSDKYNRR